MTGIEELPPGEDFRDEEYPDEHQADETTACPHCGRSIHAEANRCPHCGDYVTPGSNPRRAWPAWFWIGILLALLVLLSWAIFS